MWMKPRYINWQLFFKVKTWRSIYKKYGHKNVFILAVILGFSELNFESSSYKYINRCTNIDTSCHRKTHERVRAQKQILSALSVMQVTRLITPTALSYFIPKPVKVYFLKIPASNDCSVFLTFTSRKDTRSCCSTTVLANMLSELN